MRRIITIVADDYGIGPETSRAILELAVEGQLGATVLMVNSPFAEEAVDAWRAANPAVDLGWHANLTLDKPVASPEKVPSLLQPDGRFWPLPLFLRRVMSARICRADVEREWLAQYRRFEALVGYSPPVINSHQHVSLFPPCDLALKTVLDMNGAKPFVRRVAEDWTTLAAVPGARIKRTVLNIMGRRAAGRSLPGCDVLVGVTDPCCVENEQFWSRWLGRVKPGSRVEVCCHPGHRDETLWGRDCHTLESLMRRPHETALLRSPDFSFALAQGGYTRVRPSALVRGNVAE
ncbi:carbohydrate deacetylase [Zavarzinella formosa]|uniref:carbohydrate deacetylase n=1 Tax=Zavarzinella formosa TaxID=360055 RepID=UPI0002F8BC69|nr:ChbG/HpnK family deacetylase [Zavarzinella formosa]